MGKNSDSNCIASIPTTNSSAMTTRQAENSQNLTPSAETESSVQHDGHVPTSLQVTELTQHQELPDLIKKAIKEAVREELKEFQQQISKLTDRVEQNESKILSLEVANDTKTNKISAMEKQLSLQAEQIATLKKSSQDAEQYSRRNCVRVFGIQETAEENTDSIILNIAKEKLGVDLGIQDIDRSHRVGPEQNMSQRTKHSEPSNTSVPSSSRSDSTWASKVASSGKTSHPRAIIIKFASYCTRQAILQARRKLKNTGISISEDLSSTNYAILKKARQSKNVTAV